MGIAVCRFALPVDDAEDTIQGVFVSYLCTTTTITNPKAWLVAATYNACKKYWNELAREGPIPTLSRATTVGDEGILVDQILVRSPQSSQVVLRLHYIEGFTAPEIAGRLRTSTRYAEQLIHRGLCRARRVIPPQDAGRTATTSLP